MNRKTGTIHTLKARERSALQRARCNVKRGLFYPHRRRLRAALALPAAALLLYSCDPPASPSSASREGSRAETKKNEPIVTTTPTDEGGELVVTKDPDGREISRVETKSDKSTITTTPTPEGGELVVIKDPDAREVSRVETTTKDGVTAAVHKNPDDTVIKTIETTPTDAGGELLVTKGPDGRETSRVTTTPAAGGGTTKELVIHSSVTAIEDKAFENNELTSLTIGNAVERIGKEAFAGNPKLKTVRITGTGAIEANLFTYSDTSGSRKGIFNESVSSGIELIIEEGITEIGTNAFTGSKLTSLTIGNNVETIRGAAFFNSQLTSLTIPPSVTTIGTNAFGNNKLTSLTIPSSVISIGTSAFYKNELTSLTIENGLLSIETNAFGNNKLTSLTIPTSVTKIGASAFAVNQLTSVTLKKGLYDERGVAFIRNPATLRFSDHTGRDLGGNE